ncbi:MAG: efflux RND transporter periplasmic adaptor subunit [Steroidobacteraceae bacterium]
MDALTEQERETPSSEREGPHARNEDPVVGEPRPEGGEPPSPPYEPPPPPGKRRRWLVPTLVGVGLLIIALLVFRGLHHRQSNFAGRRFGRFGRGNLSGQTAPVAVTVARASYGSIAVRIPALGTVTPLQEVTVQSQISGYLQRIAFTEGQKVRAGDLLAVIDPRTYQAALDQAKANLIRDKAQLAGAESDYARYQTLIKQDAVSQQQLVDEKFLVSQYQGTVASDQAAVESASVNLAYCRITSPISGRVGLRQVDAGNYVTPAEPNGIVIVTQLEPISVIFPVAEDEIPGIQERLKAGATLEVDAYDRTDTTLLAKGKVLTLDNEINTTTGTVNVRALFSNQNDVLFPNQFVNVHLIEKVLANQLVIPTAAVRHGEPNGELSAFVYVVDPNRTVSVRPVKLGITDGERVAVESGLSEGDLVVTEGGDRLRAGARVAIPNVPGSSAAGAAGAGTAPPGASPRAIGPPRSGSRRFGPPGSRPPGARPPESQRPK